jgi:hypothetical protein
MKNPHRKSTRCCAQCGQAFSINPRLGRRHRYCAKLACQRVRRAANLRRWLKRNGGRSYYRGQANGDRVRHWRAAHPGYWRRGRHAKAAKFGAVASKRLAAAARLVALQNSIDADLALKIGLISELMGTALQDSIAKHLRRLILRGYAILRGRKLTQS